MIGRSKGWALWAVLAHSWYLQHQLSAGPCQIVTSLGKVSEHLRACSPGMCCALEVLLAEASPLHQWAVAVISRPTDCLSWP